MTIDRAVMAFAGSMVLLSLALSQITSSYWLLLAASWELTCCRRLSRGFCPLAMVLRRLGVRPGPAFP